MLIDFKESENEFQKNGNLVKEWELVVLLLGNKKTRHIRQQMEKNTKQQ